MSKEREGIVFTPAPDPTVDLTKPDAALEQAKEKPAILSESIEVRRAKLTTILERGVVGDRLHVELPNDLYGEWVRNDPMEISRAQALGFWVDVDHASKRALHTDGNKAAIIGDVVFMVTTRENKALIDSVQAERIRNTHNPKKPKEEKDFEAQTYADTGGIIPTLNEGKQRSLTRDEIAAALNAQ